MSASSPSKLLVRGVNWLGDAVMSTPALLRLREAMPGTHITLLTRAKLADLWHAHPAIDDVFRIEPGESMWATGAKIRGGGFDCALVLPNSPRSALEVWLAGVPRRIGYTRPWRNWFLTDVIPTRPGHMKMRKRRVAEVRQLVQNAGLQPAPGLTGGAVPSAAHQMHEYLHLATTLGALGTPLAPALAVDATEVRSALSKFAIAPDRRWLGLNAGAEYGPAKRWPKDR
ncbi:MAG: hypothetical protein MUC91_00670, partial [Verrucomicrobia bacterium]|nr:hypothetical protein [Verrucomicrobiota bacterium]